MGKSRRRKVTVEVNVDELDGLVDSARERLLNEDETTKLKTAIHALVDQLRPDFRTSEKSDDVLPPKDTPPPQEEATPAAAEAKPKRKGGNGRNGASDFTGATKIKVEHDKLKRGCTCPDCCLGKVYPQLETKGRGAVRWANAH